MSTPRRIGFSGRLTRDMLAGLTLLLILTATGLWLLGRNHETAFSGRRVSEPLNSLRLNPNTASLAELRALPSLGPVRARAVIDYRRSHPDRPFTRVEDLQAVSGVGPAACEKLREHLVFPEAGNE